MSELFSVRKRLISLGLMGAVVVALAVLGTLWGLSQTASAQAPGSVVLVHLNPDGTDYTGNPYCPDGGTPVDDLDPTDADGDGNFYEPDGTIDRAIDDCNNIVSQNHVIRTEGLGALLPEFYTIEGVGVILTQDYCGVLPEVTSRALWGDDDGDGLVDEDPVDTIDNDGDGAIDEDPPGDPRDGEACVIIHSSTPGETRITFTYLDPAGPTQYVTGAVIKEWDSLVDTVILKAEPADEDGDTDIDAADHHLADVKGTWENDDVVWDEGWKRVRSYPPVPLVEIVHGEHEVLINNVTQILHQPTQGAIIKVWIESERGCTYFTTRTGSPPFFPFDFPYASFGTEMNGISDGEGRFVGPQVVPAITMPAGLQIPQWDNDGDGDVNEDPIDDIDNDGDFLIDEDPPDSHTGWMPQWDYDYTSIYVDTMCEERAEIHILVGYPDSPSSLKVPVEEWIGINWVTTELAKQPVIRWAGEEIVLEKRWALPDSHFPNVNEDGTLKDICPNAFSFARYNRLTTSTAGDLVGGLPEMFEPYTEPDRLITIVDAECISRALASSEDQGEGDFEVTLHQWCTEAGAPVDICSFELWMQLQNLLLQVNAEIDAGRMTTQEGTDAVLRQYDFLLWQGEYFLDPDEFDFGEVYNKHAFLVWWLKIYQVKLTNVDGAREFHNAGAWDTDVTDTSTDTEEDTLNVSADTLLRVQVKGYFETTEKSGRPDVCVDMDGDGNGLEGEEASEPGVPYQTTSHVGCADPDDRVVPFGHWVLPDDLVALAGADPSARLANWDVMSDIDETAAALTGTGFYIGPKSTLDSHDHIIRPWLGRKTVDPDGELTVADAIMPVLKITAQIADPADAGFLKDADKYFDVDLASLFEGYMIPYEPEIPPMVNNGGYDWDSWGWSVFLGPYWFYDAFNIMPILDPLENTGIGNQAGQSGADPEHPRKIQFYTDNRGQGYFFANGDYNLDFGLDDPDGCVLQALFGAPDCEPGDVVGESTIEVIGDYPYFRKHPNVASNPVVKTWTWGGFKEVTHERIDATHTRITAHLKDRDGYCKYDVDEDDGFIEVLFSPSEHPVQHEEISFILNTEVGSIVSLSPAAVYSAPHFPLGYAWVTGTQDGVLIDRSEAVVLAEDVRVLDALGVPGADFAIDDEECMAWIVIEHPADEDPDVSVYLHDPEGTITRHWPPTTLLVNLVTGWNDACYVGPEATVEDAAEDLLGDLNESGVIDLLAIYRFNNEEQTFDRWFPEAEADVNTIETLEPYDQLFVLMELGIDWLQEITPAPESADLVEAWNSICYAGASKGVEDATSNIIGDFEILYSLGSDQMWRRFVPGEAWLTNIVTLNQYTSVFLLVTTEDADGDGVAATWIFDP